jgi:hypothetical protein
MQTGNTQRTNGRISSEASKSEPDAGGQLRSLVPRSLRATALRYTEQRTQIF